MTGPETRSAALRALGKTHGWLVHRRRVRVLASVLGPLIEPGWRLLDIGCGDGALADLLRRARAPLTVEGLETHPRAGTMIPVRHYDGAHLPVAAASVDAAMLVDVLHHADDPLALLGEAARVARHAVIIKDHRLSRPGAKTVLRFMDWVGNRAHGASLPYDYWSEATWRAAWERLRLSVEHYETRLGLYPGPARWLFESGLHFVARLGPR